MKISDLLSENAILIDEALESKNGAIDSLINLQIKNGNIQNKAEFLKEIMARENHSSTAVGEGVAIPHAKSKYVKKTCLSAITTKAGVDFDAPDNKKSNIFFMIAATTDADEHLEVLSHLMKMIMDKDFRQKLLEAKTPKEFIRIVDEKEKEFSEGLVANTEGKEIYKVVAVTACPTGIAHTYMAAKALEDAAKGMGISIKVETNGSGGAKNKLTQKDIENAAAVIIAADKSVETDRFNGKKLLNVNVSAAIKDPKDLINRALSDEAQMYFEKNNKSSMHTSGEHSGRKVYKQLMNGVSNMLPFVVGGGIFIAIAFLIDSVSGTAQNQTFGSNTPVSAFFKSIGDVAFSFMIPVLAGYIGKSIADRPGLLVGFVGGFLASSGATFSSAAGTPSGFLGALFAGFVGGYVMLGIEKICDNLPESLEGIKSVLIYPLAGLAVISIIMCTVNPFMGYLNNALTNMLHSMGNTSRILLGIVLGAMMSVDMGGPFNKAAYVFGTAAITTGNYDVMAAVMVGGMVPPIAIALATTFFKDRFSKQERKGAAANYIMGLSFITEGAIPYAASDPLRVIPACMIGSGVAGGLSMLFNCSLMAPHGGIFVFAVVGNWPMYFVSLVAGSIVGMFMLGLFKRKVKDV